jgi:hypothetical protein
MTSDKSLLERPFDGVFRWILLGMALWSYSALAATGQLPDYAWLLGYPLLTYAWIGEKRFPLPAKAWMALLALFMGVFALVFAYVGRTDAFIYLFIFLLVNKLWSPKKARDILQIIVLCFFIMLAASVMTVRISFIFFFLGFLFLSFIGLVFLTIQRELEALAALGAGAREGVDPRQAVPKDLYGRAAGGLGMLLLLSGFIFIFFPRLSPHNYMPGLLPSGLARTGHSSEIRLGSASAIIPDTRDVMRVGLNDPSQPGGKPLDSVYMRGSVAEHYERGRWSKDPSIETESMAYASKVEFNIGDWRERRAIEQEVFMNPGASMYLFALGEVFRFQFNHVMPNLLVYHDSGTCSFGGSGTGSDVFTYKAISFGAPDTAAERPVDKTRGNLKDSAVYLAMPESPRRNEVASLALEIVETAGAVTDYEKAKAFEGYLQANFSYSMMDLDFGGDYPTEVFLLDERRGHCEHFASAMAMLLRQQGIPCRLVNGYYSDRWNEYGGYFLVQRNDAHSWLEAYFDGAGWLAFDPSPPADIVRDPAHGGLFSAISKRIDAMRMKWYLYVIDYDSSDWGKVFSALSSQIPSSLGALGRLASRGLFDHSPASARHSAGRALRAAVIGIVVAAAIFTALTIGPIALRRGAGRKRKQLRKSVAARRVRVYERILDALSRRGVKRPLGDTPLEFAAAAEEDFALLEGFSGLTEQYYRARYAGASLTPEDESEFKRFLKKAKGLPKPEGRKGKK